MIDSGHHPRQNQRTNRGEGVRRGRQRREGMEASGRTDPEQSGAAPEDGICGKDSLKAAIEQSKAVCGVLLCSLR